MKIKSCSPLNMSKKSFTLIELLVVISVIALISSIVLVSLKDVRGQARDAVRFSDLNQYRLLLMACYAETGKFPDCLDSSQCDASGSGYRYTDSCNCTNPGDYQNVILTGCPSITSSQLPNDPINTLPYAYFLYYFEPSYSGVNAACRGKYVFMANLEMKKPDSPIVCSVGNGDSIPTPGDIPPYSSTKSQWLILGP